MSAWRCLQRAVGVGPGPIVSRKAAGGLGSAHGADAAADMHVDGTGTTRVRCVQAPVPPAAIAACPPTTTLATATSRPATSSPHCNSSALPCWPAATTQTCASRVATSTTARRTPRTRPASGANAPRLDSGRRAQSGAKACSLQTPAVCPGSVFYRDYHLQAEKAEREASHDVAKEAFKSMAGGALAVCPAWG